MTFLGEISGLAFSVSEPDNVDVTFSIPPKDSEELDASEEWTASGAIRLALSLPLHRR